MLAFRLGWREKEGGLGKYGHCRKAMQILWPDMEWNEWLERMVRGFCNEEYAVRDGNTIIRVVTMVGVAAAGKTFSAGRFCHFWWLCDPQCSIGILTSTTKGAIGQRVWPVIENSHYEARRTFAQMYNIAEDAVDIGNLVSSQKILQARKEIEIKKGDTKHAIFAQAVKDGETAKAEAFIKGQHAERIFVMVDEADETPPAIFSAVSNLRKACQDLTIVVIANPTSRLNPHGRCATPKGGWGMKPINGVEWPTQGVPEWQIEPGVCLQFKGSDSPNVKAGRTIHKHIYTWEDYKASQREGVRNTLPYWKYDAGDWAPDGVCNTVFNETMALANGLTDGVLWLDKPIPISFVDPGFGGDACIQGVGKFGTIDDGNGGSLKAVLAEKMLEIELVPDAKVDFEHQIFRQVKANCEKHGVSPKHFGIYATGTGRGVASIMFTDWSDQILKVEEGGSPSEMPASMSDPRPAKDVYDRRVTELWFSAQAFAIGRQLRGVDNATLIELCAREYETVGKPWKYRIETKEEFKPKLGHSPDRGDTLVGMCWLVRERLGGIGGSEAVGDSAKEWNKNVAEQQDMDAEPDYSDENARELVLADSYDDDESSW